MWVVAVWWGNGRNERCSRLSEAEAIKQLAYWGFEGEVVLAWIWKVGKL